MWTQEQRDRMALENQYLKSEGLDQFCVYYDNADDSYSARGTATSNSGRQYTLWTTIPSGYPYSRPSMYLTWPLPLLMADGTRISSLGISHIMHTLTPSSSGHVQLCHWRDNRWHGGILLYRVFLKGLLWIEAYEQHLSTGRSIADFVTTMKETA
jgi:hypothetical protein